MPSTTPVAHAAHSIPDLCRAITARMVRRSLVTAVVVGGVLFGVNSGEALAREGLTPGLIVKALVTMTIPFVVSLSSAAATRLELRAALGGRAATCATNDDAAPGR